MELVLSIKLKWLRVKLSRNEQGYLILLFCTENMNENFKFLMESEEKISEITTNYNFWENKFLIKLYRTVNFLL